MGCTGTERYIFTFTPSYMKLFCYHRFPFFFQIISSYFWMITLVYTLCIYLFNTIHLMLSNIVQQARTRLVYSKGKCRHVTCVTGSTVG